LFAAANMQSMHAEPKRVRVLGDRDFETRAIFEADIADKRIGPQTFIGCSSFDVLPAMLQHDARYNGYRPGSSVLIGVGRARRLRFVYAGILVTRAGADLLREPADGMAP
jgi:hypothetical protein